MDYTIRLSKHVLLWEGTAPWLTIGPGQPFLMRTDWNWLLLAVEGTPRNDFRIWITLLLSHSPIWLEFLKSKILSLVENFLFLIAREDKYSPVSVVWKVNCAELGGHHSIPRLARVWKGSGLLTHSQGEMEVDQTVDTGERCEWPLRQCQRISRCRQQGGIKIARRKINNLRYADGTTPMAENEEELKILLMRVEEESEKAGLKLNT